jgi:hypothetical protein
LLQLVQQREVPLRVERGDHSRGSLGSGRRKVALKSRPDRPDDLLGL